MQSLLVVERSLDPQIGGARQNAFCERQDALYVEFIDGFGVMLDLGERQFFAQLVTLAAVAGGIDRLGVEERFVEPVELLCRRSVRSPTGGKCRGTSGALEARNGRTSLVRTA